MVKKYIKRYTPDRDTVRNHRHLRIFGRLLHDPNLWHMNRRSVAGSFAIGLFWAFIPIPLQMLAAAATAIPARVNLPISVATVWLTNPLTMPPIFYFNYRVGTWILGEHPVTTHAEISLEYFFAELADIWQPLILGSLVCGVVAALIGFAAVRVWWRWWVIQHLKRRRLAQLQKQN
jgi:uncharacterized protein (DUF2062 family)